MPDQVKPALIANARMYSITPGVADAWRALFEQVGRRADVPLVYVDHAAPTPLEELWSRGDLALAFMCGFPFAVARPQPLLIAAPVPSLPRYGAQPVYCTDFVVRADSRCIRLSDTFGGRIGWTAAHSQSGFNAVRHHLLRYRHDRSERLFAASIGPLVTPRHVIEAVIEGSIDVGPLDSFAHDLLKLHEPDTASRLRAVEHTMMTAIPPLIAAPLTPPCVVERLRRALFTVATEPMARSVLAKLLLAGFVQVDVTKYEQLLTQASKAESVGYFVPV
jgi:ABC-type phosphate/phosphonate transport system substrate-binding protein